MTAHEQITAEGRRCALYAHTGTSKPVRLQLHHRHPEYLQQRLWHEVRLPERVEICGTCHDSVHAWLSHLLGEAYQPPTPPARVVALAQYAYDWFRSQQ